IRAGDGLVRSKSGNGHGSPGQAGSVSARGQRAVAADGSVGPPSARAAPSGHRTTGFTTPGTALGFLPLWVATPTGNPRTGHRRYHVAKVLRDVTWLTERPPTSQRQTWLCPEA